MHRVGLSGTDVWSCFEVGMPLAQLVAHHFIASSTLSHLASWLDRGMEGKRCRIDNPLFDSDWFLFANRLWKYYRCSVVSERLFKQLRNLVDVRSIGHRTWRDGKNKLFLAKMIPRQTKPTNQKKYMFIFPSISKTFLNPPRMGTTWQPPHVSDSWLWHEKIFGFVHCFESLAWRLYLPALCLRLGA